MAAVSYDKYGKRADLCKCSKTGMASPNYRYKDIVEETERILRSELKGKTKLKMLKALYSNKPVSGDTVGTIHLEDSATNTYTADELINEMTRWPRGDI